MNPLRALREAGQSVWLDTLRRGLATGGTLERLIREDGLAGVTSNPTIFGKAIGGSTDYDEPIRELVEKGTRDPVELFYDLALGDIEMAADLFASSYQESDGEHGLVSFELEARLAHDTAGSIDAARTLFERIGKPNAMIKVPGTPAGVPAVEELTAAGVNVNITLLFSVEMYEQVAEAYVRGLERRLDAGDPVGGVRSVASFFVSRVDTAVDAAVPDDSPIRGKVAVANAKLAYRRFREIFSGDRWARLAAAGAHVQRPLWASTSAKNPAYRDVLYVEELVGHDTVNTMPQATLDAFRDHGVVRPGAVEEGLDEAAALIESLPRHGVDLREVTDRLTADGIEAFDEDFRKLLEIIEGKVHSLLAARVRHSESLGGLEEPVRARLDRMQREDVVGRIWRMDHTVWKPSPDEITDRLGWLGIAGLMRERLGDLRAFADGVRADGLTHAVLLGMGGSSLAPEVLRSSLGVGPGALELLVLDTTHPESIDAVEAALAGGRPLFVVASKSGETVETLSHLRYFWRKTQNGAQFAAITDPGTPLETLAHAHHFRAVFTNPSDIGGRYSALSLFGLVPAALIGADLDALIEDADEMACACDACVAPPENPGAWLGAVIGEAARAGRDKLTLVVPPELGTFDAWLEQLIAESTGKEGRGVVPVTGEHLGPPEVYGDDRIFVALGEHERLAALEAAGHPVVRLSLDAAPRLGAEFFRWEMATAVAGHVLEVNPFDQPDVAAAKRATAELLERPSPVEAPGARAVLETVRPGDHLAIQAFIARSPEAAQTLERLRLALRDRYRVATTLGFGPRYLHSTGQLHKGGPPSAVCIQVVDHDRRADLAVPGTAYTFRALLDAQQAGDLRALISGGRRVAVTTLDELAELAG